MSNKIAVWGDRGTYSDQMAHILFPDGDFIHTDKSANPSLEVMSLVKNGTTELGILPFWNEHGKNSGMPLTYEKLADSNLFIQGISRLRIVLHLASRVESLEQIETIYMFEVVKKQCSAFINKYLPKARIVTDNIKSTKDSLKMAMDKNNAAGIGIMDTAKELGIPIVGPESGIQNPKNYTHFLVLSSSLQVQDDHDNTLLIARLTDKSQEEEKILHKYLNDCVTGLMPERQERIADGKRWYIVQVEGKYSRNSWISDSISELKKDKDVASVRILGSCRWIDPTVLTKELPYC